MSTENLCKDAGCYVVSAFRRFLLCLLTMALRSSVFPVRAQGIAQGDNPVDSVPDHVAQILGERQAQWTFMLYLDGDNNLEGPGIGDFLEMASVGSTSSVNILVQFDRSAGHDTTYDDWTTAKRFRVTSGMTPAVGNALQDLGEVNMGDPQTLIDFVQWGMANYPAAHYAVVLWDHGSGWRMRSKETPLLKDIAYDDSSGGDALDMPELLNVMDVLSNGGADPIDLIGLDACLMAMIEVDNQFRPYADVRVGSEATEPGDGWPYDTILSRLVADPTMSANQLAAIVVDDYYTSYGESETQSAVDLGTPYAALNTAVDNFAAVLIDGWGNYSEEIVAARSNSQEFDTPSYVDLYDFAYWITIEINDSVINPAATAVMNAVDGAVIRNQSGEGWPGAHGISIYFPQSGYNSLYDGDQNWLQFTASTRWDEWLHTYDAGTADDYEVDDTSDQANWITNGSSQVHSIVPVADVDWVKFSLAAQAGVVIKTSGTSGDTRMWLYDSNLNEVEYNDDGGDDFFSLIDRVCDVDALEAGTYYVKIDEYNNDEEIISYNIDLAVNSCVVDDYEVDDTSDQANWISPGFSQVHSIVPAADVDWVKFSLTNQTEVVLETWGDVGDTRMWLYDSNMNLIEYNDDDGDGLFSLIDRVCDVDPLAAGTYYVKVDEYGNNAEISSYSIGLTTHICVVDEYEVDDTSDQANWITGGSTQVHSIVPDTDVDWVKFSLTNQAGVVLETSGVSGDTRMWLYDSNMTLVEHDDDGGGGLFSLIDRLCEVDSLEAGTYYVKIDEYNNNDEIGSYDLELTTNDCVVTGPPLDVYLLVDLTGSFEDDLPNFQAQAPTMIRTLRALNPNTRFGLGKFEDYPIDPFGSADDGDQAYQRLVDLTFDTNLVLNMITGLYTRFGDDTPESQLAALYQAATGIGQNLSSVGYPEASISAGQQANFRSEATKLILLWTDAPFHRPGDSGSIPYPGPSFDQTVRAVNVLGEAFVLGVYSGGSASATGVTTRQTSQSLIASDRSPEGFSDLKAIVSATGAFAGDRGVDCDNDGSIDVTAGQPLVCGVGTAGEGIGEAIIALVGAERGPAKVFLPLVIRK